MEKRAKELRKEVDVLLAAPEQADNANDGIYGKGKRGDRLPEELRFKTRNPCFNNVPGGFRVWMNRYSVRSKR